MAEEQYTFTQARARLEEIVVQVRRKDVSLEKSLDLLEEGVRLANSCTELIDHTEWRSVIAEQQGEDGEAIVAEADDAVAELADAAPGVAEDEAPSVEAQEQDGVTAAPRELEVTEITEVAVVEIAEDGTALVEVTDFVTFAEADDAWPDDAAPIEDDGEVPAN